MEFDLARIRSANHHQRPTIKFVFSHKGTGTEKVYTKPLMASIAATKLKT